MNQFVTADPATCIDVAEGEARELLAEALDRATMADAEWPLTTEAAAKLLCDGLHFEVDEPALRKLGALGQAPAVDAWDARDILAATAALDARRQWQFGSPLHAGKFHQSAKDLAECLAAGPVGIETLNRSFKSLDLRMVLILLTECQQREPRERLLTTVLYLLARDHGVVI